MRSAALAAALLALAGCVAPQDAATAEEPALVEPATTEAETLRAAAEAPVAAAPGLRTSTAFAECGWCYEPTVAVDGEGRVYVTTGRAEEGIAVSSDAGASWTNVDVPPLPGGAPPTALRGDATVQVDPQGRLVYHALLLEYVYAGTSAVVVFDGFQVAASADGGRSWAWNAYVAPATTGDPYAEGDRQWLAFGADGVAYMTQNQYAAFARPDARVPLPLFPAAGTGLRAARSDDGGRTWGAFAEVVARPVEGGTIGGQPVVDGDGRLLIPYFVYGEGAGLFLASSSDGGASFAHLPVHAPREGYAGAMFPSLAVRGDELHMAWWKDGEILFASSGDGGESWSAAVTIGSSAAVNSPWLVAGASGVEALWSEKDDETSSLAWLVRGEGRMPLGRSDGFAGREAYTDFLHAAPMPDGGLAVVLVGEGGGSGRVDVVFAPAP